MELKEKENYVINRIEDLDVKDYITQEEIAKLSILYKQNTYSIQNLLDLIKDEDLVIPDFQRGMVWKLNDKIEFIESILIGIPIPSLYLASYQKHNKSQIDSDYAEQYLIIDGLQRINALKEFILEEKFKLKSKAPEWHGKKFSGLSEKYKKRIKRTFINAISIVDNETDPFMLFHIFARINKGGTKLSYQQIRNSIYQSIFIKKIQKTSNMVAEDSKLIVKEAWKRKDTLTEIIVRVLLNLSKLLFYIKPNEYENSEFNVLFKKDLQEVLVDKRLTHQLNIFCYKWQSYAKIMNNNDLTESTKMIYENFLKSIQKIKAFFQNREFTKQYPLIIESVISFELFENQATIKQKQLNDILEKILSESSDNPNNPFYNNTNTKDKVISRFNFIRKILDNYEETSN